jgi:integrase
MPRQPKPWYKASHDAWYCKLDGKLIRLAEDESGAWREFHRIMSDRASGGPPPSKITVVELLDRFLVDRSKTIRPETLRTYTLVCQLFVDWIGRSRKVVDLRGKDVAAFLESRTRWGKATKAQAVSVLRIAFKWGETAGWVDKTPLVGLKVPAMPARPPVDPAEIDRFLELLRPDVKDLLLFMVTTGCRPGEACSLTAASVDFRRAVAEVSGKAGVRTIVLPVEVLAVLRRLVKRWPEGQLFRNTLGRPWEPRIFSATVRRFRRKYGFSEDLVPYSCRGAFATRAIANQVDVSLVAKMLGHSSLTMLHKHYHRPAQETLLKAVEQAQRKKKTRG